jgi:MoaA/NifB/PqqE/SkfB family radical SAM enzyme
LTKEEVLTALKDDLFSDLEEILLTGGEATLRTDLEDIIIGMHELFPKARIWLSTNAIIPKRTIDIVETAMKHNIPFGVGVSLDGIGKEHDFIRGTKGNFERADKLLRDLVILRDKNKDKLGLTVGFTISDLTSKSLKEVESYAKKLDVTFLAQMYEVGPFYHTTKNEAVSINPKWAELIRTLPNSFYNDLCLATLTGKKVDFPCFAMYTFCVLRYNGDISPCLKRVDLSAGNVKKDTPSKIWQSAEAKKVRGCVKSCEGCLNTWGVGWSVKSALVPFFLTHPNLLAKSIKRELSGKK